MTPVVHLDLRISLRIFEKIRNDPIIIFKGLGEGDSWKKPEAKNLVTLSLFKPVYSEVHPPHLSLALQLVSRVEPVNEKEAALHATTLLEPADQKNCLELMMRIQIRIIFKKLDSGSA